MVRPVKAHKTDLATFGLLLDRKLTTISVSNPTNSIWTGDVFRSLAPRLPPVMDVRKVEKMGSKMRFAKSKPPPHRTTMFVKGSMVTTYPQTRLYTKIEPHIPQAQRYWVKK